MNKKIYVILALCLVLTVSLALAACQEKTQGTFEWNEYTAPAKAESTQTVNLPEVPSGPASEPSVQIHYQRLRAADYPNCNLWLWTESGSIGSGNWDNDTGWTFNYKDSWGAVALYTFTELGSKFGGKGNFDGTEQVGIIPRVKTAKDMDADRIWTLGQKDANNYYHVYLKQGDTTLYNSEEDTHYSLSAKFVQYRQIEIKAIAPLSHVAIYEGDDVIAEADVDNAAVGSCTLPDSWEANFSSYKLKATFVEGNKEKEVSISSTILVESDAFAQKFNYDGDLGALYSASKTEFKVWSPLSESVTLKLYNEGNGGTAYQTVPMTKGDKGVWSATVNGDLAKKYYTYTVVNSSYPQGKEIVDPYAKSAGLNGRRGQIVNFADPELNPNGWDSVKPIAYKPNELVVWETHVADVTSSSTWGGPAEHAKKFLGLIDENTTYTDAESGKTVTTGFDHIKELGVNAVQLVPIFDQANDEENVSFNWGYNPLNYNVLEGAYSTDPTDGYTRIKEFKQVVMAYNAADINIIMDVVYNHVSSADGSNFDVLCPGYYFRYTDSGALSSGSGCGNDTASNHYMFRKFMIDSVTFWAKEYKLGGFRFDLMGLHDLETMNQLTAALKEINPDIIVYGEPWQMSTACDDVMATQVNGNQYQGFAQFNDKMRDALIKGGLSKRTDKGWADVETALSATSTEVTAIVNGLKGFTYISGSNVINDLAKTVNYVTCHDNYTLYDRIVAAQQNPNLAQREKMYKNMAMLADSVVLTSNGITFMLAGDEFMRSKADLATSDARDQKINSDGENEAVHNSYESSYEMNSLNYALKITNEQKYENFKKLIAFKTSFVQMGLVTNADVAANYKVETLGGGSVIKIDLTDVKNNRVYRIVHANYGTAVQGINVDFDGYTVYLDTRASGVEAGTTLTATTSITRGTTLIAYKAA